MTNFDCIVWYFLSELIYCLRRHYKETSAAIKQRLKLCICGSSAAEFIRQHKNVIANYFSGIFYFISSSFIPFNSFLYPFHILISSPPSFFKMVKQVTNFSFRRHGSEPTPAAFLSTSNLLLRENGIT